jgi:Holliday junction DNA helicase RuvB
VALRLLRRLRDYAQVRARGVVTGAVADQALSLLEIDELGLDDLDRRVLDAIIVKFNGGPVGLDTLAASISEESDTIMDVVEPYLLQLGFLDRTPRGRVATRAAYAHMKIDLSRAAGAEWVVRVKAKQVEIRSLNCESSIVNCEARPSPNLSIA